MKLLTVFAPTMGLEIFPADHSSATWHIFTECFPAISSTRLMISLSDSLLFFSNMDPAMLSARGVAVPRGRAR